MGTVFQVRGANGSGKSHLVRQLIIEGKEAVVAWSYPSPTRRDPSRQLPVPAYRAANGAVVVGPYYRDGSPMATGGLDNLPSFEVSQAALRTAVQGLSSKVVCEGVLASTVFGSWARFAEELGSHGHSFVILHLDTPLPVCLDRIRERQRASGKVRQIKEELVADKVIATRSAVNKFRQCGVEVLTLDWRDPLPSVLEVVR